MTDWQSFAIQSQQSKREGERGGRKVNERGERGREREKGGRDRERERERTYYCYGCCYLLITESIYLFNYAFNTFLLTVISASEIFHVKTPTVSLKGIYRKLTVHQARAYITGTSAPA